METVNQKVAKSNKCMVATAHPEATKVGIRILEMGGNAFDAAAAVGFALSVCEPHCSSLGGGGFMTAHNAELDKNIFVDFREVAPKSAKPSMWELDEEGEVIGDTKSEGGKSICTPGEVAGLCYIQRKYGKLTLKEALSPAIELAYNGFEIAPSFKKELDDNKEKFLRFKEEGNPYLVEYSTGDTFKNPHLGDTLSQIAEHGEKAFYSGDIAQRIIDSANKFGAEFTLEDFSEYKVSEIEPLAGDYRGYDILTSPPPSSGGTHVIQILNFLETKDLSSIKYHSAEHLHLLSEVFKMIFADRKEYMGDPNFVKLPLLGLTSKEYAKKRMQEYEYGKVSPAVKGDPFEFEPTNTTHYSIADEYGNIISLTKTISAFFGSGVVPPNTGVVLNCQMRCFSVGECKTNSVAGLKKPLSSMSPTIMLKYGKPFAVVGTPGGNRIITTVAQIISNLVDYNMGIKEAIEAPRCYNDNPNVFNFEGRITEAEKLGEFGQKLKKTADFDRFFGGVQGILYEGDHCMVGCADPRRLGTAMGLNK